MASSSSISPLPSPSPPSSSLSPSPSPSMLTNEKKAQVSWNQQIVSSKLYQASARVNLGTTLRRGKATVRKAANAVLAAGMANRVTRWSRAILKRKYFKDKVLKHTAQRIAITPLPTLSRILVFQQLKRKRAARTQINVTFLAWLVPGCRKQKDPVLATALEVQVRLLNP